MFELRNRQRRARDVRRLGRDDRSGRVHHHQKLLCLGGDIRGSERLRRQREAGEDVDLVANDQFLREAFGDVRIRSASVLADELDLLARDRVAVLFDEQLDTIVHLRRGVGELARVSHDQTDFYGVLRLRDPGKSEDGGGGHRRSELTHGVSPLSFTFCAS